MKKSIAIVLGLFLTVTASQASAATINLAVGAGGAAGDHILGEVFTRNDLSGGQADVDAQIINALRAIAPVAGGTRTGNDPEYFRSSTNFGALPVAVETNARLLGNDGSIVLDKVYQYLVVGWDGPNGGSEAYYIGDLAVGDTINLIATVIPSIGKGVDCGSALTPDCGHLQFAADGYGITHSTLLNPTAQRVPDGGMTLSLLGMALAGMGVAVRRFKK